MHYKLISLAILLFFLFACKKEEPICHLNICGDWEYYTSVATINGENTWYANYSYFQKNDNGTLRISLKRTNTYQLYKENIGIQLMDWTHGIHKLFTGNLFEFINAEFPIAYFGEGDDDLVGAEYYLLEGEGINNFVNITEISADSSEVSGTYNMSFYRSEDGPGKVDHSIPDTLHFTNGVFRARKWR